MKFRHLLPFLCSWFVLVGFCIKTQAKNFVSSPPNAPTLSQNASANIAQLHVDLADTLTLYSVHTEKKTWRRTKITLTSAATPALNHSDSAKFRGRGNSSWVISDKKPYRFKLDKSHALLGGAKGKAWVLLSQPMLGSLLTNPIGFRAAQLVGTVAANHVLPVELYVNQEYRGLYLLTEQVDAASNSVKLKDESKGVLLELDDYDGEYKEGNFHLPVSVKSPEAKDYIKAYGKEAEKAFAAQLRKEVKRFTAAVKEGKAEEVMDVEAFARYFFVNALCDNRELRHPKSTFVHRDDIFSPSSLWTFGPVWDVDWAFGYEGTYKYLGTPADSTYLLGAGPDKSGKDFFRAMFLSQSVRDAYQRVCHEFVEKGKINQLAAYVKEFETSVRTAAQRDWKRWYAYDRFGNVRPYPYATAVARWQTWLRARAAYLVQEADHWQQTKGVTFLNDNTITAIRALPWDTATSPTDATAAPSLSFPTAVRIFDLSGRRLSPSETAQQSSATPRLLIVNGKKVIR